MTTSTVTIEVDEATAQVARALMAKAQGLGKSTRDLIQEMKTTGQGLLLGFDGAEVVFTETAPSAVAASAMSASALSERLRAEARQTEQAKLRQLLMDGLNSEAGEPITQADWEAMKEEVTRRAAKRAGSRQ